MIRNSALISIAFALLVTLADANPLLAFEEAADAVTAAADGSAAVDTEAKAFAKEFQSNLNALWVVLAAILVFFMQAGFAMVETGFTRAKNACNIMMKNLMDFSIGSLVFWLVGFGLMFGATSTGYFGTNNFFFKFLT